jgi:hypothetical protein
MNDEERELNITSAFCIILQCAPISTSLHVEEKMSKSFFVRFEFISMQKVDPHSSQVRINKFTNEGSANE